MDRGDKCQLLLHVAMDEESAAIDASVLPLEDQKIHETFKYHRFVFYNHDDQKCEGILLIVGEIGTRTRDAITMFCNKFHPDIVINIGISGRVGSDAKVGDVVVPTHLNIFDVRGAVVDAGKENYEILPGGQPVTADRIIGGIVSSDEFRQQMQMPSLNVFAKDFKLNEVERSKLENWSDQKLIGETPAIISGPFVVGNFVAKSEAFRSRLLDINRNFIAIDMESAHVGDALNSFKAPSRFFSIRAISDPGDHRKKEFDAVGNGVIRKWAMNNILTVVKLLLKYKNILQSPLASEPPPH